VEVWALAKRGAFKGINRGVSPVVATIILSAIVIAIGGAIWNYSQGAATVIANDYVNGTMTLLKEVIERFAVEHASNSSDGVTLYVWVYNYGEVDITVDVYANSTVSYNSTLDTFVGTGEIVKIEVYFTGVPLQTGDEVSIKAHSRRQNNAYYTYYSS
jgi:flagellin-like protein